MSPTTNIHLEVHPDVGAPSTYRLNESSWSQTFQVIEIFKTELFQIVIEMVVVFSSKLGLNCSLKLLNRSSDFGNDVKVLAGSEVSYS